MTEQPPPDPPDRVGQVGGLVKIVQSLTLTHVLIIALLIAITIPTYIAWRAINDPSMLNTFLSRYEETNLQDSPCTLRVASRSGAGDFYAISTGFAIQGNDRWLVTVHLDRQPDPTELDSYCKTLELIVDFMRRPNAPSPKFPNSDEPLIWTYPKE